MVTVLVLDVMFVLMVTMTPTPLTLASHVNLALAILSLHWSESREG